MIIFLAYPGSLSEEEGWSEGRSRRGHEGKIKEQATSTCSLRLCAKILAETGSQY